MASAGACLCSFRSQRRPAAACAMQLLAGLAGMAAESGKLEKRRFVDSALRELSVVLWRGAGCVSEGLRSVSEG